MSLTYLNAAMIELPAYIAELSARNFRTTALSSQTGQIYFLSANNLIVPNIGYDTNIAGNLTVYGGITALSGFNVIGTTIGETSSLRIINLGDGPALAISQVPTTDGILTLSSSGTEVLRVNSTVPDINQGGVVVNWPGIGPALLVNGLASLSSLNVQGQANINNLVTQDAFLPTVTSTNVQTQNLLFPNEGGYIFNNTSLFGNITIYGAISALSGITTTGTFTNETSSLSVVNTGVGPALYVSQAAGPEGVAIFVGGDGKTVLAVNNSIPNLGQPAVNVMGRLSATTVYAVSGGNSLEWNSTYNTVVTNSADWERAYDIGTAYQTISSSFITSATEAQTLSLNVTSAELTISGGNTISLTGIRGAVGGGTDRVFYENDQVITTSYTITSGKNAMTAGPVTIMPAVSVTVFNGSIWTVV